MEDHMEAVDEEEWRRFVDETAEASGLRTPVR
jgi:hypothetical protein